MSRHAQFASAYTPRQRPACPCAPPVPRQRLHPASVCTPPAPAPRQRLRLHPASAYACVCTAPAPNLLSTYSLRLSILKTLSGVSIDCGL
ncbi:hypothetical protein J2TS4_19440 [Paenibacillus sp. J2TS4]|nr:hypothetical protein J2TS4_19440 [Paenibacillus sp. J2TS4]